MCDGGASGDGCMWKWKVSNSLICTRVIFLDCQEHCSQGPCIKGKMCCLNRLNRPYCWDNRVMILYIILKIGCAFCDADDWHSESNVEKMQRGIPLTDQVRCRMTYWFHLRVLL